MNHSRAALALWAILLPSPAALILGLTLLPSPAAGDGRLDYMLHCQGCHLADGSGKPGAVPSLRNSMARFLGIPGGRDYLIRVPGSANAPIGDASLAAVLNWMINAFGPAQAAVGQAPFDAREISSARGRPLLDAEAARASLISRMRP